jgi:hypothetical protein
MMIRKFNSFFEGNVTIGSNSIPKLIIVGLVGVSLLYLSVAGMISANASWMVRGDSEQHVDYAWRLYHGELPKRPEGVTYQPIVEHNGGFKAQAASKNPPLFYAIHAPIIGPIFDSGNLHLGIAVGRAVNLGLGVLCILALSWAGWLLGGTKRYLHAVAVPALSVLIFRFVRLNVDFAVDVLLVLFGTLSIIYGYKIFKYGLTKKYLIYLTLITVAGMLTKVAFIGFFALNLAAVFVAGLLHNKDKKKLAKSVLKSLKPVLIIAAIVLAATGWYYYIRNYKVSGGNWFNAVPMEKQGHGREVKTLWDVLTSDRLRGLFTKNYIRVSYLSQFLNGFAFSGALVYLTANYQKIVKNRVAMLTMGLVFAAMLTTLAIQIAWAVGTGSINFRYMLPALVFFGLFLSYGLLQFNWARGQFAAATSILMGAASIRAFQSSSDVVFFENGLLEKIFGGMYVAAIHNGLPAIIPTGLLIAFAIGGLLLIYSLFRLSKNYEPTTLGA